MSALEEIWLDRPGDDEPDSPHVNYPPLFNEADFDDWDSSTKRTTSATTTIWGWKFSHKSFFLIEWALSNTAALMFVIGSFLFNPTYSENAMRWAAILFITGSLLFTITSSIVFMRNDCASFKDPALSFNALLYIAANSLFVIGSVFFLPTLEEKNANLLAGLFFFVFGSTAFFLAPFYDIYRILKSTKKISRGFLAAEISVSLMYMVGNACFIIGSILFMPFHFQTGHDFNHTALVLFIFGSFAFMFATLVLSIRQAAEEINWFIGKRPPPGTAAHAARRGDVGSMVHENKNENDEIFKDVEAASPVPVAQKAGNNPLHLEE